MFWNYNGKVQVDREEAGKLSFSIMGLVEMIINVLSYCGKNVSAYILERLLCVDRDDCKVLSHIL